MKKQFCIICSLIIMLIPILCVAEAPMQFLKTSVVEAIEEYKIQAIISIINKAFAGVSIDKILEIIENRQEIKDVIGKYFNDVISGLKNVGANI